MTKTSLSSLSALRCVENPQKASHIRLVKGTVKVNPHLRVLCPTLANGRTCQKGKQHKKGTYLRPQLLIKNFGDPDLQLVTLKVELAKPFIDFIEEYRRYFGSQHTTEQICMSMIYDQVKRLFNELNGFARKKNSFLDESDYFKKFSYLGSVSWEEPEQET